VRHRSEQHQPLDHAAKEIVRLVPDLILRVLKVPVQERRLRFADASVRSRELRADHVLLVGDDNEPDAFGVHLEFQAGDDRREFARWNLKNAALNVQLKRPVALVIIYLQPGAAPSEFEIVAGGISNHHHFSVIRLWELEDRIRDGDLPELAPFLVLWNHEEGVAVLEEQRDLILAANLSAEVVEELFGWTMVLGNRFFPFGVLSSVFEEEIKMLKDFPPVQQWIEESRLEGERIGEQRAGHKQVLEICKRALTEHFGPLSPATEEYLELRTADELGELIVRSVHAPDLSSLGVPE
jgi:hypothetical protein